MSLWLGLQATPGGAEETSTPAGAGPGFVDATTPHVLQHGASALAYTATAGTLPLPEAAPTPRARMFYVGYTVQGADTAQRPITFVVNGGPGAASVYLHLGALGPKRLALHADGTLPPAPARLVDNPFTWLMFTDLVFIDPVGTGYSRGVPHNEPKDQPKDQASSFWGLEEDLRALESFIRLYLTRHSRWGSPKFLTGESYGGFRVGALAERLQTDARIALNGVVLVSPVLEFSLLEQDAYRLLPWVLRLPSYAAVAQFHGKATLPEVPDADAAARRQAVEHFSVTTMLPGLAQGDGLVAAPAPALYGQLAQVMGLPEELVSRYRGKVPLHVFVKALLRDTQRLVSVYDGTYTAIDPNPASATHFGPDPQLDSLTAAFTTAFHSYIRDELHFITDAPYLALNMQVSRAWKWHASGETSQGFVGTATALKRALSRHPNFKALLVHGAYDLVTPYFSSAFVVRQMDLASAIRPHLVFQVYAGGHMFYTHAAAHEQFWRDAQAFFRSALPPAPATPAREGGDGGAGLGR